MTDSNTTPAPAIPPLALGVVHDMAQKGLTVGATYLTTHGVLTASQGGDFVQLGLGVAAFAASVAWTLLANRLRHSRYAALLNAAPPTS